MKILETERLSLRQMTTGDAGFALELLNDPAFLRNIGDRGVRTSEDARQYILKGPVSSYERSGFGLYVVELKDTGVPIGMCGLLKRDSLEDVDIGFAFLPQFRSKGHASESAAAVLAHGRTVLGLKRIVAIVHPDNAGSIRVLEKLGLRFERTVRMPGETADIQLFAPEPEPEAAPRTAGRGVAPASS